MWSFGYRGVMSRTLVIKLTAGAEEPERANQAFTVAATAVAAGATVSLWLTGEAVWFAVPGRAEAFELPHAAPLADLLAVRPGRRSTNRLHPMRQTPRPHRVRPPPRHPDRRRPRLHRRNPHRHRPSNRLLRRGRLGGLALVWPARTCGQARAFGSRGRRFGCCRRLGSCPGCAGGRRFGRRGRRRGLLRPAAWVAPRRPRDRRDAFVLGFQVVHGRRSGCAAVCSWPFGCCCCRACRCSSSSGSSTGCGALWPGCWLSSTACCAP